MNEGAVYRCRWKRVGEGYKLWVLGLPQIKVEAGDLDAGADAINDLMLEHGISSAASLELTPLPPVAETMRRYTKPELYQVWGDQPCYCASVNSEKLLTGTLCTRCNTVSGTRNEVPLVLDCSIRGDGGSTGDASHSYSLFSEEFLEQLTPVERVSLTFRPIEWLGRRRFFELVGPTAAECVGVRGKEARGWRCDVCGHRVFSYVHTGLPMLAFVCRETLPTPLPIIFAISEIGSAHLVMTAKRWEELRDLPRSRGIMSQILGVVPAADVETPELLELKEIEEKNRQERANWRPSI